MLTGRSAGLCGGAYDSGQGGNEYKACVDECKAGGDECKAGVDECCSGR